MRSIVVALTLGMLAPGVLWAWPGDLDPTFGSHGKVLYPAPYQPDVSAFAGALEPDDRIDVAGTTQSGVVFLARFATDGTLDPTFGTGGTVTTGFSGIGRALVRQPDGRLITTIGNFGVARFNSDGTLDTTFGTGGSAIASFGGAADAFGLALQPDGGIVEVGTADTGSSSDFAVARYDQNGNPDVTFGVGGKVTTDFGLDDRAVSVIVEPDGHLAVAGQRGSLFALARYDSAGTLDPSFVSGGMVTTGICCSPKALVRQPDGRLVVAGDAVDFVLARFATDGTLDSAFGTAGVVQTDFRVEQINPTRAGARSLLLQPDGDLVAVGYYNSGNYVVFNEQFALARYDSAGRLDPTFTPCGVVLTPFRSIEALGSDDTAEAALLTSDGKIVAIGHSCDVNGCRIAVARYGGPPTAGCSPAASGRASLRLVNIHGGVDYRDVLHFRWLGSVDRTDFGDPVTGSDFHLCLVDKGGVRPFRMMETIPGGQLLPPGAGGPGWRATSTRYDYRNKYRIPEGISPMNLVPASNGQGHVGVHGKGQYLLPPPLPLSTPVIVRVKRSDGPQCWEATFSSPRVSTPDKFQASSD